MAINWNTLPIDISNHFLSLIIDIFFRDIEARGTHHIPKEGPVFFVGAPHANQFLDPLVLNRHSGRRIYYLIAKKSYDKRFIGDIAKLTGSSKFYLILCFIKFKLLLLLFYYSSCC